MLPSLKDKIPNPTCPKCSKTMEPGFVASKAIRLRWVNRPNTKTIFSGKMLRIPFSWWSAPSYSAARCNDCGIVLISYDQENDVCMDLNQNVNPWAAALILAVMAVGVFVLFWAVGEESKARAGSYFLEHDKRGNLSVQMDHMVMRFSPEGQMISSIDLRNFGAKDVMGNIVYFTNGDFLFRVGEPERGIKSYFSLGQLPPNFPEAENLREEWVKDLDAKSGLNRCNPLTGKCDVLVKHNVPWRYRLLVDEEHDKVYFTEGTKHQVKVMDLQGRPIGSLRVPTKFPKRVRAHENRLYLIDTNNHRVIFIDDDITNASPTFNNVIPPNAEGRKWPIDAIYFDDHWWVINADVGMTNSHLVKFDKEWCFIERITLPDKADPLDMIVYNEKLVVSDVRLGNLYKFNSAVSSPDIMSLKNVTAYVDYLAEKRQFFANVKNGVWVTMGLFILIFFVASITARKKL